MLFLTKLSTKRHKKVYGLTIYCLEKNKKVKSMINSNSIKLQNEIDEIRFGPQFST
jgi:hypothetical protein